MAATTLELTIKGLALCFYKGGFWNVIFVSDDDHPAKYSYVDSAGGTHAQKFCVSVNGVYVDVDLNFESAGILPRVGDPYGTNADTLVNLSADYAHGSHHSDPDDLTSPLISNLEVWRTNVPYRGMSWMKVPQAVLKVDKVCPGDYYIQEQDYPGSRVELIGKVGLESIISFKFDQAITFEQYNHDTSATKTLETFQAAGGTVKLTFDNDCKGNCTHNDFLDLYDVVRDFDDHRRQYAGGQIKERHFNAGRSVRVFPQSGFFSESGNCENAGSIPPPRP